MLIQSLTLNLRSLRMTIANLDGHFQKFLHFSNDFFMVNAHKRAGKLRHRVLRSRPCADVYFASVRGGGRQERVCGRGGKHVTLN